MNKAITTDRDNDIILTWDNLIPDYVAGMACILCLSQLELNGSNQEHGLDEGPIASGGTSSTEWIEEHKIFRLGWRVVFFVRTAVNGPQDTIEVLFCHTILLSDEKYRFVDPFPQLLSFRAPTAIILGDLLEGIGVYADNGAVFGNLAFL